MASEPRQPEPPPSSPSAGAGAAPDAAAGGDRSDSLVRHAGTIGFATFISRILGFFRDVVFAQFFGAGLAADAFLMAFGIPNLFRRLFSEGSLTSAFIPVYSKLRHDAGEKTAREFAGGMALGVALALGAVCLLGILFAGPIVRVLAPGFVSHPPKFLLTVRLTRIMFPFLFFIGLSAVFTGVLNSSRHFFLPALSPAMHNIMMIAALYAAAALAGGRDAAQWLAWGVVAGGIMQLLMQIPPMAHLRVTPVPSLPWRSAGVGMCLRLMGPAAFGISVLQLNVLIGRWLASFLEEGSVSYLYYANRLVLFPHGMLSLAVLTAAFPMLSDQAARPEGGGMRRTLSEAGRLTLLITLPSTFGLIALARPIMEVLFQRGAFGPAQTAASAAALQAFSLGLVFFGAVRLLVSAFHARQDTRFPVRCASMGVAADVIFSLLLMFPLRYVGLALATSIASVVNATLLYRGYRRRWERDWPGEELWTVAKAVFPLSAGTGLMVYLVHRAFWPEGAVFPARAGFLLGEIALMAWMYLLLCRRFVPEDYALFMQIFRRRIGR